MQMLWSNPSLVSIVSVNLAELCKLISGSFVWCRWYEDLDNTMGNWECNVSISEKTTSNEELLAQAFWSFNALLLKETLLKDVTYLKLIFFSRGASNFLLRHSFLAIWKYDHNHSCMHCEVKTLVRNSKFY